MNNIIYIDITQFLTLRYETGIQRVLKEFLLLALNDNNIKVIYYSKRNRFFTLSKIQLHRFLSNIKTYKINKENQINLFNTSLQKKILLELDSVWNESHNSRKGFYNKLKKRNFKIINFIYDLIPIKFPKLMRKNTQYNFPIYIDAILKYSDKIIFDSNSAKNDFITLYSKRIRKRLSLDVVLLGSDFKHNKRDNISIKTEVLNRKFILFVGTLEPRKRHDIVLQAFEKLYKKDKTLNLYFIGKIGWGNKDLEMTIKNHNLLNKNFFHFTNINDNQLNNFYQNALIVTYLSDYEGFGLPIVESLYHKNITIASNNSSMKELDKEFIDYINNNNVSEIYDILNKYIFHSEIYNNRKKFIEKNYKINTWNDFYINLMKIVQSV